MGTREQADRQATSVVCTGACDEADEETPLFTKSKFTSAAMCIASDVHAERDAHQDKSERIIISSADKCFISVIQGKAEVWT